MYTLKCSYYDKSFETLDELIEDVLNSGMDPNYEVLHNGEGTSDILSDLIME